MTRLLGYGIFIVMNAQPELHKIARKAYIDAVKVAKGYVEAIVKAQAQYRETLKKV